MARSNVRIAVWCVDASDHQALENQLLGDKRYHIALARRLARSNDRNMRYDLRISQLSNLLFADEYLEPVSDFLIPSYQDYHPRLHHYNPYH